MAVRVRMAEISAVLVAAPLSLLVLLFFSCLSVCLFHYVWPGLTQNGCEMCAQGDGGPLSAGVGAGMRRMT